MNVKIITPLMTVAACTISVTAHSTQPTDSLTRQLLPDSATLLMCSLNCR